MWLFLQSKQKLFDFHMRALHEVECNGEVRKKLFDPIGLSIQESFRVSNIAPHVKNLREAFEAHRAASSENKLDSLITKFLLVGLKLDQDYAMQSILLSCREIPLEKLWRLTEQVHDSYSMFDSLVDTFNWNTTMRTEIRAKVDQRKSPFGTPAELACKYIHELSQEICQGGQVNQEERTKIDHHIQALNSNYYFCGYHIIVLQWLASLLCYFTSFGFSHIDVQKFKEIFGKFFRQNKTRSWKPIVT